MTKKVKLQFQTLLSSIKDTYLSTSDARRLVANLSIGDSPNSLFEVQMAIEEGEFSPTLNCHRCWMSVTRHKKLIQAHAKNCGGITDKGFDVRECKNCRILFLNDQEEWEKHLLLH